MCAGVGSGSRFRKGRFRRVPEFRRVLKSSGACWCAGVCSGGKFRKVPGFPRVPV